MGKTVFSTEPTGRIYKTSQGHRALPILKYMSVHRNDDLRGEQIGEGKSPCRAASVLTSELFSWPLMNSL